MKLIGIDFTSSPTRKKPIALAFAAWAEGQVVLVDLKSLTTPQALLDLLRTEPHFLAAIDMPFGLPRELIEGKRWPGAGLYTQEAWSAMLGFYAALTRDEIRQHFKAWCDARPEGKKFAHRATDKPAGSSPSMKWVNPPVAYMLHAGAPLLQAAGVHIPGMQEGDRKRVAVEAYPGYLARKVLNRQSYKSDDPAKDSPDRRMARSELLCAMEDGMMLGIRVKIPPYLRANLLEDSKADHLDALICALIAAWCEKRADSHFGLPPNLDPVEGWIAAVPWKTEEVHTWRRTRI